MSILAVYLESERVRVDFLTTNATAHKVTTTTATITKMRHAPLNSGKVGLGDAEVPEEYDMTKTVLETKKVSRLE